MSAEYSSNLFPSCETEPIHIPGAIQPHGFLVALDERTLQVTHASANLDTFLSRPAIEILDKTAEEIFGEIVFQTLLEARANPLFARRPTHLKVDFPGQLGSPGEWDLVAHTRDGLIMLEAERVESLEKESLLELHSRLEPALEEMAQCDRLDTLAQFAAKEVRQITGFDRVLIYRFDPTWNGHVIAEDGNGKLPSYLDLRFPAGDIPKQARELYRLNRLRLIANCDYTPVGIVANRRHPLGQRPLDLSLSTLRSVSPVHLQYMRNMGTASSMSVSIIKDQVLWGLISCHHHEPKRLSFARRSVCELLGHVLSLHIATRETNDHYSLRLQRQAGLTALLTKLSTDAPFNEALAENATEVMNLVGAQGLAIFHEGRCSLRGTTPAEDRVRDLAAWLGLRPAWEEFHSDRLGQAYPPAEAYASVASGLLALSISKVNTSYLLWFRPEQIQTVTWAGDPRKEVDSQQSLTPRLSFQSWKETVRGRSLEWLREEIDVAHEFRQALVNIVLKRAEELASLALELGEANRELAAFSYSVSHDLRAPFRHIRSYAEILRKEKQPMLDDEAVSLLDRILDASQHAGRLVDNLLAFAKMGRATLRKQPVDVQAMVSDLASEIQRLEPQRKVVWRFGRLPKVKADMTLLHQVWQNLLENAFKYSRTRDIAQIEIDAESKAEETIFQVKDNGVGFDPRYQDKLFGVFQRLHRSEDFEGTGLGLANVRRIVERHGGKTWANGKVGEGATFYFSLPAEELTFDHA